jgi:hypothetical protein
MRQFLRAIIASLLSTAAVGAAIVWLLQPSAEKYIGLVTDQQLEVFKHTLDEKLESFKAHLTTVEAAEQLRFNQLLSFRAKQISEFYWPIYIRLQIDNAVWERALGAQTPNRLPPDVGKPMEQFILDNHKEILKIIESEFYLAELTPALEKDLLQYVRHVAVYMAMRTTKHYDDKVPVDLNEPWPKDLFPHFQTRLDELQSNYNGMLKEAQSQQSLERAGPASQPN